MPDKITPSEYELSVLRLLEVGIDFCPLFNYASRKALRMAYLLGWVEMIPGQTWRYVLTDAGRAILNRTPQDKQP